MHKPQSLSPPGFSDSQIDQLLLTLRPLTEVQREALLEDLADTLRQAPHQGSGQLYRVIREVQRRHWDPPLTVGGAGMPRRWER